MVVFQSFHIRRHVGTLVVLRVLAFLLHGVEWSYAFVSALLDCILQWYFFLSQGVVNV